jgi:hypothetical protein
MKNIICLFLTGIAIHCSWAQQLVKYEWNVSLKVIDETGNPIAAAHTSVGYFADSRPASLDGLTDASGLFTASHEAFGGELGFTAEKTGYYTTSEGYDLGFTYDPKKWNPSPILVLKKIIKPIPMYAKHVEGGPPVFNKPIGYDLEVGDWVGPYGKGVNIDLIFDGKLDRKSKADFDYELTVSFPNQEDGIQEFNLTTSDTASILHSSQNAPTNGYKSQVIRSMSRHPGQGTKEDMYNPKLNYYFRVRTKVDDRGNIVSAHYGKIYGDFMQFTYYLNPTPNDRNVEFDPKENLMTNLKFDEGVSQP